MSVEIDIFYEDSNIDLLKDINSVTEIKDDIEIKHNINQMIFSYEEQVIGTIDFSIEEGVISVDFIGNVNMPESEAERYGVQDDNFQGLSEQGVSIKGLGLYMLRVFLEEISKVDNKAFMITGNVKNPYVSNMIKKLEKEGLLSNVLETIEENKKYIQACLK